VFRRIWSNAFLRVAMAHFDHNAVGAYSCELAFLVIRWMGLPLTQVEELLRRWHGIREKGGTLLLHKAAPFESSS